MIASIVALISALLSLYAALSDFAKSNSGFFMVWEILNMVPGFLALVIGGHGGSISVFVVATAIQWFLIGLVFARIMVAERSEST